MRPSPTVLLNLRCIYLYVCRRVHFLLFANKQETYSSAFASRVALQCRVLNKPKGSVRDASICRSWVGEGFGVKSDASLSRWRQERVIDRSSRSFFKRQMSLFDIQLTKRPFQMHLDVGDDASRQEWPERLVYHSDQKLVIFFLCLRGFNEGS
jgi:hypothetical protein